MGLQTCQNQMSLLAVGSGSRDMSIASFGIRRRLTEKLNEVGFQFRLRGDLIPWGVHFEELKQYKAEHDNFVIPRNHPRLGSWSVYQKAQYKHFAEGKKSTLDQFKVEKLISIGFLESEAAEPLDLRTTLTNTTSNL
mmetsp:Transcript_16716/g.36257  ORF Transcript_16716/g.36257 Transcript_16716/m.36257 type:complete len:137 (-) Transcript_16716:2570-2980(-)